MKGRDDRCLPRLTLRDRTRQSCQIKLSDGSRGEAAGRSSKSMKRARQRDGEAEFPSSRRSEPPPSGSSARDAWSEERPDAD